MITMETINGVIFAPVFFFFAVFLFIFAGISMLAMFHGASSSVVLACVTFVLGYNSWMFALKLKNN